MKIGILGFPLFVGWMLAGCYSFNAMQQGKKGGFVRFCELFSIAGGVVLALAVLAMLVWMLPTILKALLVCVCIWFCVGTVLFAVDYFKHPSPIHWPKNMTEALSCIRDFVTGVVAFGVVATPVFLFIVGVIITIVSIMSWVVGNGP